MLENSFRLTFFLKSPKKVTSQRLIYLRITVDGIAKETSTKQKWDVKRWDQQAGRATGNKEDAKAINFYLDSVTNKIVQFKAELILNSHTITAQRIIDFILGKDVSRAKLLDEFQRHNDEMRALVDTGEYAIGTHTRFVIAKCHVKDFIEFKYHTPGIEFRDRNYEFIKDYEFYLKTVKHCNNNTTLKHITYVRKMVLRAINKDILQKDPFGSFRGKRTKVVKSPLNLEELSALENYSFATRSISIIDNYPTGVVQVAVNERGSANYTIAYPAAWDKIQLDEYTIGLVANADELIFGSLVCRDEVSRQALNQLLDSDVYKVFDVNLRNPHYTTPVLENLMNKADFIKFNDEELLEISASLGSTFTTLEENIKFISEKTATNALCVTKGKHGAILLWDGQLIYSGGYPATVADTVGAGDSFLAALIAGLLKGSNPQYSLNFACATGALIAEQPGANPEISYAKVEQMIASTSSI